VTAAVVLQDARKSYGQVEALRGVSFSVEPGEVVAMLGPNGAGKTTAISILLGLRNPTTGTARLFGLDPRDRRARSRCGVMLQESGVPSTLRVRELVDLFRCYYPAPLSVAETLQVAGLSEQANQSVGQLSGGQKQRVYFALAICGDPEVIFFDEPTVGMDVEARRGFLATVRSFAASGKTIFLTTHYLEEADELAERILVIDRGVLIADASPREIKARVAGKRVSFRSPGALSEHVFDGLPLTGLQIDGDRVRLLSSEPETVLGALFARKLELTDLEVVGADLEEAFLTLTGRSRMEMVS
jgi:ABC-2 type transport system ATP-binding protein